MFYTTKFWTLTIISTNFFCFKPSFINSSGRINETWFKAEKVGTYYGQCSELCGIKHAFMPIAVKVVSEDEYQEWLSEARVKFAKEEIENDKLKLASK